MQHVAALNGLSSDGRDPQMARALAIVRQRLFAAVNGRKPRGLEIALDGAKYTRPIVSLDHPDAAERALTA
jgi:hypothetical protein